MLIADSKREIELSHERCKVLGIKEDRIFSRKIIDDTELQEKFAQNRKLIVTAAPYIEQLINFVKGCNFFALLTDGEGCILNASGDEKILSEAFDLKMVPGAFMNEESIGTNAMSLVIKTGQPVQISGKDHFITAYHRWTCSAAPIKDNRGYLIGALNLTGYTQQVHPHTLGMVIAASNAIEEMAKVKEFNKLQNLNSKHIISIFNSMPLAIVTSDISGNIKIHNNKAVELFGNTDNQLKAKEMKYLVEDWDRVKNEICLGKSISQEINIMTLRSRFPCRLIANTVYNPEDDNIEIVHVFEEAQKAKKKNEYQAYYTFDKIIGENENFLKIIQYAKKIADSKSTILILGESGTGKEVFAQSIHNYSSRMDGPFIALNCGAIPNQLIESELFGYEEGAFTGAKKGGNLGKFELANGGTIMLDEIGEMPLDMQTKLLRVLQEGVVTKIGSSKTISVDVRVIAATNKDLKKEVEMGRFRKDLYYRLNVLPLYLPPLRQRKEDILLLIKYFMGNISEKLNKKEVEIHEEYLNAMLSYSWPGNIRELENVIELIINTESVPSGYFGQEEKNNDVLLSINKECLNMEHIEKEHLEKVLKKYKGNITRSAQALGIRRNTLYSKIRKYEIEV
ncbi:sigma-54-dependent Fis family transcriptional regulator [Petroclostridium sp. X23]|uniref:sigma-54-dependent Fis family transcriptional regulator n=1 Tax=Petroclostridium sp. X23 TaxID=3045146 RepID=UPI0024ADEBF8|nr:sigma-54-dependent Fis family transcriptional regulator [Petroclostridium sp. X23]WHH58656.1 sigma-54-dependent Fis family transcriptional regulator [Petroclostridium sp. X23]